jgi:hypothetical protein
MRRRKRRQVDRNAKTSRSQSPAGAHDPGMTMSKYVEQDFVRKTMNVGLSGARRFL